MGLAENAKKLRLLREEYERREDEMRHELAELERKARDVEEKLLDDMAANGVDVIKIEGEGTFKANTSFFAKRLVEADEFNDAMQAAGYGDLVTTPKPSVHGGRLNSLVSEFMSDPEQGGIPDELKSALGVVTSTRILINGKGSRK